MKERFDFLKQLAHNNNREWFIQHKTIYQQIVKENKIFFQQIFHQFEPFDKLESFHVFRIYKDVRFSKDKLPYKTNYGAVFKRQKPHFRGGYYIHLEPNNSFVGGGFWSPSPSDLFRIRKEFETDSNTIEEIVNQADFKEYFGILEGEDAVKTSPKGFDKNSPAIHWIKKKQFIVRRLFTDEQVFASDFPQKVIETFMVMRPFFDYMSEVLTTDINGEPLF